MSEAISGESAAAEGPLNAAEQALQSGHFASARRLLAQVQTLEKSNAQLAARRLALQARLSPDPMVLWLIALCLLLYVAIIATTA